MNTNRNPDLVLALDRIADAARQDASEAPLQVILELAEDALADRPRQSPPLALRVADALATLKAAETRLRFAGRHASVEACGEAESVIRDLARIAGVEVPAEKKEAA